MAIDPAGNAVVTWSDPGWGAVHASFRPAGQTSFGPPQRLSELGGRFPQVAFDGGGNALVAWARLLRGDPEHWLVETARVSNGGKFGEPEAVSPLLAHLQEEDIQLAVARGGRALIAYTGGAERRGGDLKVWGALADAGEPFGGPTGLSPRADHAFLFDAGLGDAGEGVVTWVRGVAPTWPISVGEDNYWEGVPVTADGFGATQPTPAINGGSAVSARGEAIYSWFDSQGYWAASAPPGGWFGEGQLVKPGKDDFYLDYNPLGNFPQNDGSMLLFFWAQDKRPYESTRPAGGLYEEPVELSGAPDPPDYETTTGDREGNVGWLWAEGSNDQDSDNGGLKLVRRKIGQPFGDVEALSGPNVNPGYDLALGDGGRTVAVWSHSSPGGQEGTWVSSFPIGPGDDYEYSPGDPFGAAAEPARRPVTEERVGLKLSCYVACDVLLTGGVRTGSHQRFARLERADLRMTAGGTRRARLALSRTAAKWVREAAARDRRVRVRVKMRVSDQFEDGRTLQREFWARP